MLSSSADVLDWGEALFSGEVLGPETTATMLEMNPVSPSRAEALLRPRSDRDCLEAGCNPDEAELVGAPEGGFCCWSTQLVYHLDGGTVIFVHANTNDPAPAAMIQLPIEVVQELGLT